MPYDREDAMLDGFLDGAREDDAAEGFGMLAALHERSLRFSEAIDRLDAEVAAHEGGKVELVIENLTGEEVEYAVLGPPLGDFPDPDSTADGKMHGAAAGDETLPNPDAERFGARLRGTIGRNGMLRGWGFLAGDRLTPKQVVELDRIADEVDQDATIRQRLFEDLKAVTAEVEAERDNARAQMAGIREAIEQLVEELRYSVTTWVTDADHPSLVPSKRNRRDVLDVEPFLERLGRIFGERVETGPDFADRLAAMPACSPVAVPACVCCNSGALAGDPAEFYQAWTRCGVCGHPGSVHRHQGPPPEHEPTHDLRKTSEP